MTKKEFIELVIERGNYNSKKEAELAVQACTEAITIGLMKRKKIQIVGFGTFSTVEVPEKSGKIPNTDKSYTKPAHTAPKFKFGKTLKDNVAVGFKNK